MQRDYFWPSQLTDRSQPSVWEEDGKTDMWERANTKVKQILSEHNPSYLSDSDDARIRNTFNIL